MIAATEVDAINAPDGVVLPPIDPGASTGALCATLRERTSLRLGMLTDRRALLAGGPDRNCDQIGQALNT